MRIGRRGASSTILGLLCAALPATTGGTPADAQAILGIESRVQASSNPLLLPGSDRSAVMGEISLKPEFRTESATGDSLDLAGVVTGRRYSRLYDDFVLGSARATGELRDSERLSIKASGAYTRDIAGDTVTGDIAGVVEPQSIRNTWQAEASAVWRPNARTMITPAISADRSTFERTTLLRGTRNAKVEVAVQRLLSEHLWVGVRPVASVAHTGDQPDLHLFALYGTVDKTLSASWKLSASAGVEHIDGARNGVASGIDRKAATRFTGALDVCRAGETTNACLTASLGSEVSALFGFQRRKAAGVRLSRRLDERRTVSAQFDYQRISAPAIPLLRQRDIDALAARLAGDWRLNQRATVSAEVQYARRTLDVGAAPHAVYFSISLRWQPRLK